VHFKVKKAHDLDYITRKANTFTYPNCLCSAFLACILCW